MILNYYIVLYGVIEHQKQSGNSLSFLFNKGLRQAEVYLARHWFGFGFMTLN